MFSTLDLKQVLRHQDELRRDAAKRRLAARIQRETKSDDRARRVLGLRLSLA